MAYNIGDKIATRDAYGATLVEIGNENKNLVVLDADLAAATKTGMFKKAHPDRFFDCGIAENNMIGAAVGLALSGKVPFASTFILSIVTFKVSPGWAPLMNIGPVAGLVSSQSRASSVSPGSRSWLEKQSFVATSMVAGTSMAAIGVLSLQKSNTILSVVNFIVSFSPLYPELCTDFRYKLLIYILDHPGFARCLEGIFKGEPPHGLVFFFVYV